MVCPNCKLDRAHRSHRSGLSEWVWSAFGYYPYRCEVCPGRKMVRRRAAETPGTLRSEVIQTRRRLKWSRVRRELLVYGSAVLVFLAMLYFITRQRSGGEDG